MAELSAAAGVSQLPVGLLQAPVEQLQAYQWQRLRRLLEYTLARNDFYARKLSGFRLGDLKSWDDFRRLPFTTKAELAADQEAHPPYGSHLAEPLDCYSRLHQTSGTSTGRPLRWLDTPESWEWLLRCWQWNYHLLGLRRGDRLFFPFSFGPFLGFWTAFEAAARNGWFCLSGGGMSTTARLRCIVDHGCTVVFATPTYALHMAEVAAREGIDLAAGPVRLLVVAGEPGGSIPATRDRLAAAWGCRVIDHYGLTEVGPVAIEPVADSANDPATSTGVHVAADLATSAPVNVSASDSVNAATAATATATAAITATVSPPASPPASSPATSASLLLLEAEYVAEVVAIGGTDPVPAGQYGELVLTNLGRLSNPLIRYRTGDVVRWEPGDAACRCTWRRLAGGIIGRVDDMIHIRGNNLYPATLEAIVRRFPEVAEYRIVVDQTGPLADVRIEIEPHGGDGRQLAEAVAQAIRDELLFRVVVQAVPPQSLPRYELKARRVCRLAAAPDTAAPPPTCNPSVSGSVP